MHFGIYHNEISKTQLFRFLQQNVYFLRGKAPKEMNAIAERNIRGTCTIVCHRQYLGGPVQTWWSFNLCCASSWKTPNSDNPGD